MKIVSIALIANALSASAAPAFTLPLSEEAVASATFEEWQARQGTGLAVLEVDLHTGDIEAVEVQELGSVSTGTLIPAEDTKQVSIPGQAGAVVESPEFSTDVPDEAGVQTAANPDELEEAEETAEAPLQTPDPFLIRLQILLDRAHVSPGEIDGFQGENTRKAIAAYEEMRGLPVDGEVDADVWTVLAVDGAGAMKTYEITSEDVDGRYVESMPKDYAELAELEWLGYAEVAEMLGEEFHMDSNLLRLLNPEADFTTAGTMIHVADTGPALTTDVVRIVVDKAVGELRAYDESDNLVLVFPASIGSDDTPSPSGLLTVVGIASEPTYSYNPKTNFQQGDNSEVLTLPAGPNGPVGSMWIDLSEPTFGIHGTAYPEMIDKSQSHGCVRLTNWDATALAALVVPGRTVVEFTDGSGTGAESGLTLAVNSD